MECTECGRDLAHLCRGGQHHGLGQDGSFADYIAIDARAAVPLPKGTFHYKRCGLHSPFSHFVALDVSSFVQVDILSRSNAANSCSW